MQGARRARRELARSPARGLACNLARNLARNLNTGASPTWDRLFATLVREDSAYAGRPTSIHNGRYDYNHSHPFITHISAQARSRRDRAEIALNFVARSAIGEFWARSLGAVSRTSLLFTIVVVSERLGGATWRRE